MYVYISIIIRRAQVKVGLINLCRGLFSLNACIYVSIIIRRAQVKAGLINLCKGLFSLNARIYYKLKSGT